MYGECNSLVIKKSQFIKNTAIYDGGVFIINAINILI